MPHLFVTPRGAWKYNDLESKNGSLINGHRKGTTVVRGGDVMTIGGSDFILFPLSLQERMENIEKRRRKTKNHISVVLNARPYDLSVPCSRSGSKFLWGGCRTAFVLCSGMYSDVGICNCNENV